MSEIKSGMGVCPGTGWQPEPTFKQVMRTGRKVLRAEASARGRSRARLLPARKPPLKGPTSPLPREGDAFRGGLKFFWPGSQLRPVQSQPACPSSFGPSLGQLTLMGEKGAVLAQPSQVPDLHGLGGHLLGFLQETSCSGPSPGQRGTSTEARTFLSVGLRPELELTGGRRGSATFQPGC